MSLRYSVTCQMSFFKRQRSVVGTWNTVVPEISKILWDPAGTIGWPIGTRVTLRSTPGQILEMK